MEVSESEPRARPSQTQSVVMQRLRNYADERKLAFPQFLARTCVRGAGERGTQVRIVMGDAWWPHIVDKSVIVGSTVAVCGEWAADSAVAQVSALNICFQALGSSDTSVTRDLSATLRGAMPAAMSPGRANGLYVVVVGEGVCRLITAST